MPVNRYLNVGDPTGNQRVTKHRPWTQAKYIWRYLPDSALAPLAYLYPTQAQRGVSLVLSYLDQSRGWLGLKVSGAPLEKMLSNWDYHWFVLCNIGLLIALPSVCDWRRLLILPIAVFRQEPFASWKWVFKYLSSTEFQPYDDHSALKRVEFNLRIPKHRSLIQLIDE